MSACAVERPQLAPARAVAGRKHSILIIDDDDVLRDVLSHRLERQQFETIAADCGATGLALARTQQPHLIILDVHLPDRDGLSVCEQLADDVETCSIPIIILTSMENPDLLRRCRAAGCHYFIHKPYDPNVLLTIIRDALRQSEPTDGYDLECA